MRPHPLHPPTALLHVRAPTVCVMPAGLCYPDIYNVVQGTALSPQYKDLAAKAKISGAGDLNKILGACKVPYPGGSGC
jgi:hypothetical protein